MKLVFYTNFVVPHQIPLAQELVRILGANEYKYIYSKPISEERKKLGYPLYEKEQWCLSQNQHPDIARQLLLSADVLISEERVVDIFEERSKNGRVSYYASERWFKPIVIHFFDLFHLRIPGVMRLLFSSYRTMAVKMAKLILTGNVKYMAQGVHAISDMLLLCSISCGKLTRLREGVHFRVERKPLGRVIALTLEDKLKSVAENVYMWGYFVAPSTCPVKKRENKQRRLLWVGRLLHWKRVDTIIKAIGNRCECALDVYGAGPELEKLKRKARRYKANVSFHNPIPYCHVRDIMRNHDVFVLSSDNNEGWGATINEAIEEHMKVLGTFEAGSSATILPNENLFHAGDWRSLRKQLFNPIQSVEIRGWSAAKAASNLLYHLNFV